mgnify:CR=1 FL=1
MGLVLNYVNQGLGCKATNLREGLFDAGDGGIEEVKEAVVVERNYPHLLWDLDAKFAESADGAKQDG